MISLIALGQRTMELQPPTWTRLTYPNAQWEWYYLHGWSCFMVNVGKYTTWDASQTLVKNGINYQPQSTGDRWISEQINSSA